MKKYIQPATLLHTIENGDKYCVDLLSKAANNSEVYSREEEFFWNEEEEY